MYSPLLTSVEHSSASDFDSTQLLEHIAGLDVVDDLGVDLGALSGSLENDSQHVFRIQIFEATLSSSADGCSDGTVHERSTNWSVG